MPSQPAATAARFASLLRDQRNAVVAAWELRVSGDHTVPALRGSIAEYLDALAVAFDRCPADAASAGAAGRFVAAEHARTRPLVTSPTELSVARLAAEVTHLRHVLAELFRDVLVSLAEPAVVLLAAALGELAPRLATDAITPRARAELLARAGALMAGVADYARWLDDLAAILVPALGDACTVTIFDAAGRTEQRAVRATREDVRDRVADARKGPVAQDVLDEVGALLAAGRTVAVGDGEESREWPAYTRFVRALGGHAYVVAPLKNGTRSIGLITLATDSDGRSYGAGDVAFVEQIAARAALAIENARLFREVETERRTLRAVVSQAPVGILVARGRDLVVELANAQYMAFIGHGREILGKPFREAVPELAGQGFFELLHRVFETGEPYIGTEMLARLADGHESLRDAYFDFVYQPMRDGAGVIDGIVIVATEVTSRVRARRESDALVRRLEGQEALLRAVLQQMPTGILACEAPSLKLLFTNPRLDEILHHPAVKATSLDDYAGYEAHYSDTGLPYETADLPLVRSALQGEVVENEDIEYVRPDGSRIVIRCNGAPVRDHDGVITAAVVLFSDVTDIHRLETERADLLRDTQRARRDAEVANEIKDQFLATVSHELRTPLNAMLGWLRLLRAGQVKPERVARTIETIERNARAQAQLVEDLLDIARIASGKLHIAQDPVDLGAVLEAAVEVVRPETTAKSVSLDVELPDERVTVTGDAQRLQQVLWNLLTNAAKFTPPGGRITARLRRDGELAEVSVEDTGSGIAAEFLPHVFERFRQADSATGRGHGGLGLGLAIVKNLVELHGGTISAHSEGVGFGSAFVLWLPIAAVRPSVIVVRPSNEPAPVLAAIDYPAAIAGLRILVLDDDADAREVLTALFEGGGATVTATSTIAESMSVLEASPVDVVVSDIGLKGEDGYTFARRVRAHPDARIRGVPMVAVTAYARSEDRARALAAGFGAHVAKPVEASAILGAVAGAVGG